MEVDDDEELVVAAMSEDSVQITTDSATSSQRTESATRQRTVSESDR